MKSRMLSKSVYFFIFSFFLSFVALDSYAQASESFVTTSGATLTQTRDVQFTPESTAFENAFSDYMADDFSIKKADAAVLEGIGLYTLDNSGDDYLATLRSTSGNSTREFRNIQTERFLDCPDEKGQYQFSDLGLGSMSFESKANGCRLYFASLEPLKSLEFRKNGVCGIKMNYQAMNYRLMTFESSSDAVAQGYSVTHYGACGGCSSLQDLAVYLHRPDLTTDSIKCSQQSSFAKVKECYQAKFGFTPECAEAWSWDSHFARKYCVAKCLKVYGIKQILSGSIKTPENLPNGDLNECIQCDEDRAGAAFKMYAGRNRRDSGVVSSIARPDDEVRSVNHHSYVVKGFLAWLKSLE